MCTEHVSKLPVFLLLQSVLLLKGASWKPKRGRGKILPPLPMKHVISSFLLLHLSVFAFPWNLSHVVVLAGKALATDSP